MLNISDMTIKGNGICCPLANRHTPIHKTGNHGGMTPPRSWIKIALPNTNKGVAVNITLRMIRGWNQINKQMKSIVVFWTSFFFGECTFDSINQWRLDHCRVLLSATKHKLLCKYMEFQLCQAWYISGVEALVKVVSWIKVRKNYLSSKSFHC